MLRLGLVLFALLLETLHEGVEFGDLLRCQDGANARVRFLADSVIALMGGFVLRGPFGSGLVDDRAELRLLSRRELKLARKIVDYLCARRRPGMRRMLLAAAPDGLSPEVVADPADDQAEQENDTNEEGGFAPCP